MAVSPFSEKLGFLRKERGYTQKEFADYLGVPQTSLSSYEGGRTSPTLEVLVNIATKCNVSIDWLCGISSSRNNISTLADVADFLYKLFETNGIAGKIEIKDRLPGDIETETERWTAQIVFDGNDPKHEMNSGLCNLLKSIENNCEDYASYSISKETYDMTKEQTKEYYAAYPLSQKTIPELTREERLKRHVKYIKEHSKE